MADLTKLIHTGIQTEGAFAEAPNIDVELLEGHQRPGGIRINLQQVLDAIAEQEQGITPTSELWLWPLDDTDYAGERAFFANERFSCDFTNRRVLYGKEQLPIRGIGFTLVSFLASPVGQPRTIAEMDQQGWGNKYASGEKRSPLRTSLMRIRDVFDNALPGAGHPRTGIMPTENDIGTYLVEHWH